VRITRFLFLASVFCVTFEKVHWDVAGTVSLADILAILFLVMWTLERLGRGDRRLPRTSGIVICFGLAFLLAYLIGYFSIDTADASGQFGKGIFKWAVHILFLVAGISYLGRRSERFYWLTIGTLTAGIVFNAVYGVLQLVAAQGGRNLDSAVLSPLTRGASSINIYGAVAGQSVYRPNALTGDPNHLGIMLIVPLLILLPVYLRLEKGHRLKKQLAVGLAFLFVVELATLSRSGLLGLGVGLLILAIPYRRKLISRELLVPLAAALALVAIVVLSRYDFFETVIRSRFQTGGRSTSAHFGVYDFIPNVLSGHPLFGLGFNTFSVYYESVTGKTNWGPHSYYVALLVETGLVGAVVFAVYLWYLFRRLRALRAIGRALAAAGDPASARVRPLAWGLTAALAGTLVANAFYLTMTFYYFYVLGMLILAAPIVFGRRLPARAPAVEVSPRLSPAAAPA
jgi:O-antigen ligase/polysaccharide polymerase Wzy-like membrane protein